MIKKQRGVTLIELLISMTLGLALIAGIGQLFVQSQKSFRLQRNVSDMTDDGSFLLEVAASGLLLAGFLDDPGKNALTTTPFQLDPTPLDSTTVSLDQYEFIHGTDDELIYRYELNNTNQLDNFLCTQPLKSTAASNDVITVRLYKANDSNNIPVIYCQVKSVGTGGTVTQNAAPLVSEVEKLVFKYGVRDKNGTPTDATDDKFYYMAAEDIPTADWQHIFAVKIVVVLRSAEDNLTRADDVTYTIHGDPNSPYTTSDHRLYKVFSKTVFLRAPIQ